MLCELDPIDAKFLHFAKAELEETNPELVKCFANLWQNGVVDCLIQEVFDIIRREE